MTSSARVDLTAEKMYSIDFTVTEENFVSACITKAQIVTYLSMVHKFTNLKHSEIAATPLCLGNISKDWSIDDMKKTGFNWYVYDINLLIIMPLMLMILLTFTNI